jgi:NAD(P)H-hydrate epimerase
MRDVDRVAVEEVGLEVLQMMENAGRALAWHVRDVAGPEVPVVVVAGNGGNGGGGLACARHLHNRGVDVEVLLDRTPAALRGPAAHQHRIVSEMGISTATEAELLERSTEQVVVDALVGYGLDGAVRSPAREHIAAVNRVSDPVVSLDVPSGIDATTGETLGIAVSPERTVTLALPKTGLESVSETLFLADIGIPRTVHERLDIEYHDPFAERDWIELTR